MTDLTSKIQTKFPNRQICSIYDIGDEIGVANPDIVVVEDWTFFQFSAPAAYETIIVVTSVEDYIYWRRMLRNIDLSSTEIYILMGNPIDDGNSPLVSHLIEQDKRSGIKFIS